MAAAEGRSPDEVPDEYRWETSLSHMTRAATEARARAIDEWVTSHVRPEHRYRPLQGEAYNEGSFTE